MIVPMVELWHERKKHGILTNIEIWSLENMTFLFVNIVPHEILPYACKIGPIN